MKSKNELKNNYMESDNDIESDSEVNNYEDVENEILEASEKIFGLLKSAGHWRASIR